jgi:hypothetical protein
LVRPDGPRQRVIAGREARAHTSNRAGRAGHLGELPDLEGLGEKLGATLGRAVGGRLRDLDVAQEDGAVPAAVAALSRRAEQRAAQS